MDLDPEDLQAIRSDLGLSEQDIAILRCIAEAPVPVRTSQVARHGGLQLTRPYLARRLGHLVDQGLLRRTGSGPRTAYSLNERTIAQAYVETDPLLREADKPFVVDRIRSYVPNESRLMPTAVAEELRSISDASIKAGDTINRVVFRRYLIDFAWASSRMEGNTYTLLETERLLGQGEVAPGREAHEAQMLRNHAEAIEYVIDNAGDMRISPAEIRGLHALLSHNLLPDPGAEGRIRQSIVNIGQSRYRPSAFPQVLEECLEIISEHARAIRDPYEQSLFLMAQLSYLQPFEDVNKRTARVAANIPLLRSGLCPLSFYGMPDRGYIHGLLAYYELGTAALLVDAYRQGYRAAAERYRSYGLHLADNFDRARSDEDASEVFEIIQKYMRAVVAGITGPDERERFIREYIDESDPFQRDAVLVRVAKALDQLTESDTMRVGVSRSLWRAYQKVLSAYREPSRDHGHGNDTPTP